MALQGPIPIEFGLMFSHGAFASGSVEPVRDFDASKDGRFVQSRDKGTGLPVWQVEVIDADPEARVRTFKVKITAAEQPSVPQGSPGQPFVPVEFAGLAVTPYVNPAGRLAYSLKATGVRVAGSGRRAAHAGGVS